MHRGRILQALAKAHASSRDEDNQEQPSRAADRIQPQATSPTAAPRAAPPPTPPAQESVASEPARPAFRGRGGRILGQMAALSLRSSEPEPAAPPPAQPERPAATGAPITAGGDEPSPPAAPQPAPVRSRQALARAALATAAARQQQSAASSSSGSPVRLTRQDSDVSRSSVVSQQFATIEQANLKAQLSKDPAMTGQPVKLSLNYITFETSGSSLIEEYHVSFSPNIESIRLRYSLLRSEQARALIGSVMHWNGTNLYLPIRLKQDRVIFESPHPVTNTPVKIKLQFVKTPPDSELMPFYNSLMHKVMNRLQFVIINRQHYSPMHKITIDAHRLEVWPGWITSIQRLDAGLKLIVDASFRVLRLATVRDIMIEIKARCRGAPLKEAFEQELVGNIIMTRYNNRAYRIDGIDLSLKPSSTFMMTKENREISYMDYMREHWNVQIQDSNQPLIMHQPKPKRGQEGTPEIVYLIPELCVTTGLTDEMRSNFSVMKAIGDHTRLPPDVRETKLQEFIDQLHTDERAKSVFADWNLSIKPTFDIVDGRRLDSDTILFGNQRSFRVPDNVDWTRPATSGPVFKSVDINNWVLMHTERDSPTAEDLMNTIKEVSRALGIKFCAPRIVKLPNDSATTYVNYGKREVKPTDQMVVILTPGRGQREDRYSACKRLYSCELPVPCQFIRCGTLANPNKMRSVTQKVVIQILSKVGGQPWAMKLPMKSFMIVGIDVYHDTIDRKKSCVGFVASMNEFCSSWWSHTFFQDSLEEIGQKLNSTIISALRNYHRVNGFAPQKIIVYRDGVGDGQLDTVLDFEIPQALNAVKFYMRDSASEKEPQFSYVIVQKRINAKLSLRERGRVMNPQPGTFLDHTITHPEYNDFYLVSQHVNQGTVNPTKYVVLTETGTLKLEHHQKLAYKMTHMYYNWCGTIRVPAPCQYAHKLAYLTGQNIRQQANERLADRLYYL